MTTPRTDDTVPHLEWAQTQSLPYAAPTDPAPVASAPVQPALVEPAPGDPAPHTAPALNPPTWSGRKTAIAAALAIGISSMGAVAAAAALPAGTTQGGLSQQGGFGPGGPQRGGFPGGGNQQGIPPGTQQGAQPGGTGGLPGQLQQGPGAPGSVQQAPGAPGSSTT
jgi:hypothetical protein